MDFWVNFWTVVLVGAIGLFATLAVIVTVGLSIFKVPYSLVIGLLAGLLNVIPWFGPAIAAVIAGISAAFVSPWLILAAVGVVLGTQQITDMFIQPRVMSEQVDLHPLLVIVGKGALDEGLVLQHPPHPAAKTAQVGASQNVGSGGIVDGQLEGRDPVGFLVRKGQAHAFFAVHL